MFEQLIASEKPKKHTPFTLVVSAIFHGFLIVLLIIAPLFFPETLAGLQNLGAPPPPLSLPKKGVVQLISQAIRSKPTSGARAITRTVPVFIPTKIDVTKLEDRVDGSEDEDPPIGFPTGDPNSSNRVLDGFAKSSPQSFVPPISPPPPVVKAETPVGPVRRGGDVQNANLVYQLKPDYPHLAKVARIQGAVILEAIIDREGRVKNLRVLSGHPLLIQAARDAVQQWRYRPTLLNGEPVEVLTQEKPTVRRTLTVATKTGFIEVSHEAVRRQVR